MRRSLHIALALALPAITAACGQHAQTDQSASAAPAASLPPASEGSLGTTASPSAPATVASEAAPSNGLRNHYIIKLPSGPHYGSVVFTVGINGQAPTAFSAPDSQADITEALHRGRNDVVVGWETDASTPNIADLRIGEQTPTGRWNTVFSLEVGTSSYGRFSSKGSRKYSIYTR